VQHILRARQTGRQASRPDGERLLTSWLSGSYGADGRYPRDVATEPQPLPRYVVANGEKVAKVRAVAAAIRDDATGDRITPHACERIRAGLHHGGIREACLTRAGEADGSERGGEASGHRVWRERRPNDRPPAVLLL
jgi:hypothetical protein